MSHAQVINLTLYEYNDRRRPQTASDSSKSPGRHGSGVARRPASSSSSVSSCTGAGRRYAVVKERSNPVDASICAGGGGHLTDHVTVRHVFTSVSYVIELRVVARKTRDADTHTAFLIHYQGATPSIILAPPCYGFLWSPYGIGQTIYTVSYTHLTLPTILRV